LSITWLSGIRTSLTPDALSSGIASSAFFWWRLLKGVLPDLSASVLFCVSVEDRPYLAT
jgi:hypothetical protein